MFKVLNAEFKQSVGCALLKMWLNCLCTTERFQKRGKCCPICMVNDMPDHIEHILNCDFLADAAQRFWRLPFSVSRSALSLLSIKGEPIQQDFFNAIAVHVYAVSKIYYRCRSGRSASPSLYRATIVELSRDCSGTRSFINRNVPGRRQITVGSV